MAKLLGRRERAGDWHGPLPATGPAERGRSGDAEKRTLTNLYNQRPTWLDLAHKKLDEAVFAAYGWDPGLSDDELLAKLLELNLE